MARPSIRAELATAIRAVNAAYNRIPVDRRPDVSWNAMDDVLEAVLAEDDRQRALDGIKTWRTHWLVLFEEAGR